MKRYAVPSLVSLALLLGAPQAFGAVPRLKPSGWVNDFAGVMDRAAVERLESVLTELEHHTGAEIAVVTVAHVDDGDIDRAAEELFQQWGIGKQRRNTGVLILCAVGDRRVRIEVGYGLEGILPDAKAGRIIDEQMLPRFHAGDVSSGLVNGALAVAAVIAQDAGVSLAGLPSPNAQPAPPAKSPWSSLALFVTLLAAMAFLYLGPSVFFWGLGQGWGIGGGSGWSGGGWGGGGGGFGGGMSGGGGASRGW